MLVLLFMPNAALKPWEQHLLNEPRSLAVPASFNGDFLSLRSSVFILLSLGVSFCLVGAGGQKAGRTRTLINE